MFVLATIAPPIGKWLSLPSLVLLIVAGAVLGTHGLGLIERDAQLILMEKIGLLMIMVLAGLQTDLSDFSKLGSRTLVFGGLTFGLPFAIGVGSGYAIGLTLSGALLWGLLYSPHMLVSFPLVAEMGLAGEEVVAVSVGGTAVTTVLTLAGYAMLRGASMGSIDAMLWVRLVVLLPLLAIACWLILPYWGRIAFQSEELPVPTRVSLVLACVFVVASLTHLLGVDAIVGAFIVGLALNQTVPLGHSSIVAQLETIGNGLFIPAFLISAGTLCNLRLFIAEPASLLTGSIVLAGAYGGKILAAWVAGRLFGYRWFEVMLMSGLTLSRAALILVIVLFGQESGLVEPRLFNASIVYVAITLLIGPLVTQYGAEKLVNDENKIADLGVS